MIMVSCAHVYRWLEAPCWHARFRRNYTISQQAKPHSSSVQKVEFVNERRREGHKNTEQHVIIIEGLRNEKITHSNTKLARRARNIICAWLYMMRDTSRAIYQTLQVAAGESYDSNPCGAVL